MYIIKVRFSQFSSFPEAIVIDSALTGTKEPKCFGLSDEVAQVQEQLGYAVNRDSFSCGIARRLAAQFLCSAGRNLRYAYTDGFLPDASFVFEYDRD